MANKTTSRKASKKTAAKKKTAKVSAVKKSFAQSAKKAAKKTAKKLVKRSAKKSFVSVGASRKSSPPSVADQIDVHQNSEYVRRNWWNWSVWIEAPSTVLNDIESVDYKLHSTFPDPVQHRTNRQEKFLLESSGWGEFTINAEIKLKNGKALTKRHWLTLEYPQAAEAVDRGSFSIKEESRRPNVFLSAGVSDLTMSNALAQALRQQNINVLKADELSMDLPWDVAIGEMVKNADLMVVLLSGRPTSSTMREIYSAKDRKPPLPIVPIVIGLDTMVPDELGDVQAINLKDADVDGIAGDVAMQVIDRIKMLPPKS
jgi:transcription initiation factor IIF auxiliary subunit